jgi:tetratricopeptide (TPR) repeat protein
MTGFRRWRALAEVQYTVGSIARGLNDYQLAVQKLRQSLELRRREHDWQGMSYPLCELAYISIMQDRYKDANKFLEQALAIARREEISDKRAEAFVAAMYTVYYLRKGECDNARSHLELLRGYMWTKEQGLRGNPDLLEGYVCLRENRPKEAERFFTRCLSSWDRTVRSSAMIGLSKVCSTTQQRQRCLNRAKTLARRWEFPLQTSVPVGPESI